MYRVLQRTGAEIKPPTLHPGNSRCIVLLPQPTSQLFFLSLGDPLLTKNIWSKFPLSFSWPRDSLVRHFLLFLLFLLILLWKSRLESHPFLPGTISRGNGVLLSPSQHLEPVHDCLLQDIWWAAVGRGWAGWPVPWVPPHRPSLQSCDSGGDRWGLWLRELWQGGVSQEAELQVGWIEAPHGPLHEIVELLVTRLWRDLHHLLASCLF